MFFRSRVHEDSNVNNIIALLIEMVWIRKMFWIVLFVIPSALGSSIECPGGRYQCPDTATCCMLPDKSYGCCPEQNAVCCDDHIHCCPQGSKCDGGMCIQLNDVAFKNYTAHTLTPKPMNHPCPTEESSCLDNNTCCWNQQAGLFGCCPMPDAVCCSDGAHCCPWDTFCDLLKQECISPYYSKKFEKGNFSSIVMKAKKFASVVCPGGEFQCPDGYTCCQLPTGNYGCCPFVNATCCSDHLHCCPENSKCDATSQSCIKGAVNITWSLNKQALKVNIRDVVCPDSRHCPENTTCCQLESGNFGCCSYANATCCSDHLHCCPSGYDCDVRRRQCVPSHNKMQKVLKTNDSNYV